MGKLVRTDKKYRNKKNKEKYYYYYFVVCIWSNSLYFPGLFLTRGQDLVSGPV